MCHQTSPITLQNTFFFFLTGLPSQVLQGDHEIGSQEGIHGDCKLRHTEHFAVHRGYNLSTDQKNWKLSPGKPKGCRCCVPREFLRTESPAMLSRQASGSWAHSSCHWVAVTRKVCAVLLSRSGKCETGAERNLMLQRQTASNSPSELKKSCKSKNEITPAYKCLGQLLVVSLTSIFKSIAMQLIKQRFDGIFQQG